MALTSGTIFSRSAAICRSFQTDGQRATQADKQFNLLLSKIKELRETRSYVLCLFKI